MQIHNNIHIKEFMLATDMTASGTTRRTPHRFMQIHNNIHIKELMLATDMTASGTT